MDPRLLPRIGDKGSAAAEMALIMPLLLLIMIGSFELANYFRDQHTLTKAVRDGARYAARQPFNMYDCGSGTANSTAVVTPTKNLVQTGLLSGGGDLLAKWADATFTVSVACSTSVSTGVDAGGNPTSQSLSGIYRDNGMGAPVVTVNVSLPYQPVLGSLGFSGWDISLNAEQRAAVMGI